jgi:hypothetical protein
MADLSELESRLSALAGEIDWPPSPVIAIPRGLEVRRPWYTSMWAVAAAAAIVLAGALLAYPPSRNAMADWVNVHLLLKHTSALPTLSPLPPGPLGKRLGLGSATTMAAARRSVTWTVLVPASLGAPDEVYSQSASLGPPQGEITLVYAARTDIPVSGQTGVSVLITEARGSVDATFFGKIVGPGTTVEPVTVGGHQGYWFSGAPHDFFFIDANGDFRNETLRLATNTLIIDDGGTVVRIEGDMTKQQALAIASSLG